MFGYDRLLSTDAARAAFINRTCPFGGIPCEKFTQYNFGYCSVSYRADGDEKPHVYAVCDHRVDGAPLQHIVNEAFGEDADRVVLVPEVVLTKPRQSFDYIALDPETNRFVGIETQAIDLRGGGVGPAWSSILEGAPRTWRERFTAEAASKGRGDNVAYGVNSANIYKRLGLQVAQKGALFEQWGSRLYVLVQDRPFRYFTRRMTVDWKEDLRGAPLAADVHRIGDGDNSWNIAFVTFEYTGQVLPNGQHEFLHVGTYRTTVEEYSKALIAPASTVSASEFLRRVKRKAGLL